MHQIPQRMQQCMEQLPIELQIYLLKKEEIDWHFGKQALIMQSIIYFLEMGMAIGRLLPCLMKKTALLNL